MSSERKDNSPAAFPVAPSGMRLEQRGMSLRDYFAGQALGFYLASMPTLATYEELAEKCYRAADAMLAERER